MRPLVLVVIALATPVLTGSADARMRHGQNDHGEHRLTVAAQDRSATDISAQRRRRGQRVYITSAPRLGPNAVRQCRAWYAPEYRLSGTVITPRMQCWWERG
jgi:hypothetical protein